MSIGDKNNVVQHKSSAERLLTLEAEIQHLNSQNQDLSQALNELADSFRTTLHNVIDQRDSITMNSVDIKNLHSKMDGIVVTLVKKSLATMSEISQYTIENTTEAMVKQVEFMKDNGQLESAEEIMTNSFVVFEEIDGDGKVLAPRLQFGMKSLPENERQTLLAKKPGESVKIYPDQPEQLRILEIYNPVRRPVPEPQETV